MLKELIDKLKNKKRKLIDVQTYTEPVKEEVKIDISISKENNIFKVLVSEYIKISDYQEIMEVIDSYSVNDLISISVLWNSTRQKVNKGTYYIINDNLKLYNILINDELVIIDERIKKEEITDNKIISFNPHNNYYSYFSCKHDKIGSSYNTRYYAKNGTPLEKFELSNDEAFNEILALIRNLENIEDIDKIISIELLKNEILDDIRNKGLDSSKIKKKSK